MITSDVLNIKSDLKYDESIHNLRTLSYVPQNASKLNYNDDIRIVINNSQDSFLLPCKSSLHISALIKIEKIDSSKNTNLETNLVSNFPPFLFSEVSYLINGVIVETIRNPGVTSLFRSLLLLNKNELTAAETQGYFKDFGTKAVTDNDEINFCINLSSIFGLCADYSKIFANSKHELLLIRARSDDNCFDIAGTNVKKASIDLQRIQWKMEHVTASDSNKLKLLKLVENNAKIQIPFRTWNVYEEPLSQSKSFDNFNILTTTNLTKPRYCVVAYQVNRKFNPKLSSCKFDQLNMKSIRLYLNGIYYPYEDLLIKYPNKIAVLYNNYCQFKESYTDKPKEPVLSLTEFIEKFPLIVLDMSKQPEDLKSGSIDVKLYYESYDKFKADSIMYTLLISDKIVEYHPFSGTVRHIQ